MPPFKPNQEVTGGSDGNVAAAAVGVANAESATVGEGKSGNPLDSPLHRNGDTSTHESLEYPVLEPTRPRENENVN